MNTKCGQLVTLPIEIFNVQREAVRRRVGNYIYFNSYLSEFPTNFVCDPFAMMSPFDLRVMIASENPKVLPTLIVLAVITTLSFRGPGFTYLKLFEISVLLKVFFFQSKRSNGLYIIIFVY